MLICSSDTCDKGCHETLYEAGLIDQGIKGQAIFPAGGEVSDLDLGIAAAKRNIKT